MLGLVVGGVLASASWRLTLFLPAAFAVVVAVMAQVVIVAGRRAGNDQGRPDLLGALTVTAGVLALVFAVSHAAESGSLAPLTIGPLVAGLALLAAFVLVERVVRAPLILLGMFARPQLAVANTCMLFQGCYLGTLVGTYRRQPRARYPLWVHALATAIPSAVVGRRGEGKSRQVAGR